MFTMSDLKKTWVVVGAGSGSVDKSGNPVHCIFSATVRIGNKGAIAGKNCRLLFAGRKKATILPIIKGEAAVKSQKYAAWSLCFTLDDGTPKGLEFMSESRHQFAFTDWDKNGKAIGPFIHGAGIFRADNGMLGRWSWQISRPFQQD